jgi:hypothetical protein
VIEMLFSYIHSIHMVTWYPRTVAAHSMKADPQNDHKFPYKHYTSSEKKHFQMYKRS